MLCSFGFYRQKLVIACFDQPRSLPSKTSPKLAMQAKLFVVLFDLLGWFFQSFKTLGSCPYVATPTTAKFGFGLDEQQVVVSEENALQVWRRKFDATYQLAVTLEVQAS